MYSPSSHYPSSSSTQGSAMSLRPGSYNICYSSERVLSAYMLFWFRFSFWFMYFFTKAKYKSYDLCTDCRTPYYCSADARCLPKTWRKGTSLHISQKNKPDQPATQKHTLLGLQGNKKYNSNCSHFIQHQIQGTILNTLTVGPYHNTMK